MAQAPQVPGYDSPGGPTGTGSTATTGGGGAPTVTVGSYSLGLNSGVSPTDRVLTGKTGPIRSGGQMLGADGGVSRAKPSQAVGGDDTVAHVLQSFNGWSTTQYEQFRNQAYQMGLTTSRTAGKAEVVVAWQTVVEEAVKEKTSPPELIKKAAAGGWSSLNPQIVPGDNGLGGTGNAGGAPSSSSSSTSVDQTSYMDPATAQGTLADAFQRLLGRNPTTAEYQAYLNSLYSYENNAQTGTSTYTTKSDTSATPAAPGTPSTGSGSVSDQTKVTQKGIGIRGAEFMAGQTAMAKPEEGAYQAATTYFNAFSKALSGPASGMSNSGPTNSAP